MNTKKADREVWYYNMEEEMDLLRYAWESHPYILIDVEFPGFICQTPHNALEDERYINVKKNVDAMKLIQLGLTFSDEHGRMSWLGRSWQVTFNDFCPSVDDQSEASIAFIKSSVIDFERNRRDVVDCAEFSHKLREMLAWSVCNKKETKWVTFHGLYDVAYLLKLITGGSPLPDTLSGFMNLAYVVLGFVYDVKYMARFCDGLCGGEIGLAAMAKIMNVEMDGKLHHTGFDILLTSIVFSKMKQRLQLKEGDYEGCL